MRRKKAFLMGCSITQNSMAHQWRKPFCSTIEKRLRQLLVAQRRALAPLQWRMHGANRPLTPRQRSAYGYACRGARSPLPSHGTVRI
jgi:hypothetical protein